MPMKEIGQFADPKNITAAATADATGSTSNDRIYAQAVFASMPTLVPYEDWYQVQDLPEGTENAFFSYIKNFDLNWTSITGTGSDTGSIVTSTAGPALNWKEVRPELQVAELPVTYKTDIENNVANFDFYAKLGGQSVRKKLVQDALAVLDTAGSGTTDGTVGSVVRAAGGFGTGSINSGSTLTPSDLDDMKALLSTGSDIYVPDIVVLHTFQYNQLIKHQDFSPNANTNAAMRAVWKNGELTAYNGMDVYHTELVNGYASAKNFYNVAGHPVFVFKKKVSACQATKTALFQVKTIDMPRNFMRIKQFMIYESSAVLVPAAIGLLRASD